MIEEATHAAAELAAEMMMATAERTAAAEFIPGMSPVTATMAPTLVVIAIMATTFSEVFEKHRIFSVTVSIYR
jgi:hypothetical protein